MVVDVEFPRDVELPAIYDALHVKTAMRICAEVTKHLDEHTVRAIALSSTDWLSRGARSCCDFGAQTVPVGAKLRTNVHVVGEAIDEKPQPKGKNCSTSPPCSSAFWAVSRNLGSWH